MSCSHHGHERAGARSHSGRVARLERARVRFLRLSRAALRVRDPSRSEITPEFRCRGCFGVTEGSKTGWRCSAGRGWRGKYVGDTSRGLGRGREVCRRCFAGPREGLGRMSEMLRGASGGVGCGGEMVGGVRAGVGVGAGWSVERERPLQHGRYRLIRDSRHFRLAWTVAGFSRPTSNEVVDFCNSG